jgi:choline dehydrogenase
MRNDTMAVVDSNARSFGVNNLRVVAANTLPLLPPGYPQETVYMLAKKIANDVRNGM